MIEFFSVATANGQKAAIMLEECSLEYERKPIDLTKGEHRSPEFLALNPVGRTPFIIDHDAGGLSVYGTMAIAIYLAEKSGQLLPDDVVSRTRVIERSNFISSDLGPAFSGQFIFGSLMKEKFPPVIEYFVTEAHRFLQVVEDYLAAAPYVAGTSYTIADVLMYPVAATSMPRLGNDLDQYPRIAEWRGPDRQSRSGSQRHGGCRRALLSSCPPAA